MRSTRPSRNRTVFHRLKGHNQCFGVDFLAPRGQATAEAYGLKA